MVNFRVRAKVRVMVRSTLVRMKVLGKDRFNLLGFVLWLVLVLGFEVMMLDECEIQG